MYPVPPLSLSGYSPWPSKGSSPAKGMSGQVSPFPIMAHGLHKKKRLHPFQLILKPGTHPLNPKFFEF